MVDNKVYCTYEGKYSQWQLEESRLNLTSRLSSCRERDGEREKERRSKESTWKPTNQVNSIGCREKPTPKAPSPAFNFHA
ncbi:hypothetical protein STEG23_035348, partial [Scotinomys teguina]